MSNEVKLNHENFFSQVLLGQRIRTPVGFLSRRDTSSKKFEIFVSFVRMTTVSQLLSPTRELPTHVPMTKTLAVMLGSRTTCDQQPSVIRHVRVSVDRRPRVTARRVCLEVHALDMSHPGNENTHPHLIELATCFLGVVERFDDRETTHISRTGGCREIKLNHLPAEIVED